MWGVLLVRATAIVDWNKKIENLYFLIYAWTLEKSRVTLTQDHDGFLIVAKKRKNQKNQKKKTTKNKRPTSEKWKARIAEPNKNKSRSVFRYSIVISKHSPVNPNLCAYLINIKHNGACQMNQNLKKLVGLSSISSRSQGTLTWNSFHVTNKATSCDQEPAREFLLKFSFFFHREIPFSPRPPITKHLLAWLDREAFYGRRHEPWRRAISATFAHKLTGPTVPILLLRPAKTRPHQHH